MTAVDPDRSSRPLPAGIDDLRLDQPITDAATARPSVMDASLLSATGLRQVVVRLSADSVGDVAAAGGGTAAQRQALGRVTTQQDGFISAAAGTVLGRMEVALNAVILEVDASQLEALAANPAVERISPVIDYALDLSETVPYIGGADVQDAGFDGTGISVAVLDSGIDYTHKAFAQILPFVDIASSNFIDEIIWLAELEITSGCTTSPARFCPTSNVTREQMATFLDQALGLPPTSTDFFNDDEASVHEGAINRLAASGITGGCAANRFCPTSNVLRQQMASFLVRAFDLDPTANDHFTDDEGNVHEADINALAESGITGGCTATKFCPQSPVTRGQMAAFLFRAFGSPSAYERAYGTSTGSAENKDVPNWPIANVVGGFDFVGEVWPSGRLAPDSDPIDCGAMPVEPPLGSIVVCDGGHGTHVADIIGGINGVAPGVDLHAVKVCSAVSTSCSGVALLLGMDYALDPNADGSMDDAVDVINMSLGSPYGQAFDDDLSLAVEVAAENGVLTVASAGNSSDKPYVTGTPAASSSALSVAQTSVPSATLALLEIESPAAVAGLYRAVFQPWSLPLEDAGAILNAPLQYGNGAGGNLDGCAALPAGSATGMVVLVDRGACDFSLKIANIAAGGAEAGIIGLIASGEPFEGGFGACPSDLCASIPGFMVHQSTSNALKSGEPAPGTIVSLDPANSLPLEGTMVGSSSRGPTMLTNRIKPEIGAPGASISAEAGTRNGTTPFGGTSGAAPMVTGAAALLMDALSDDGRSPAEIKALLMNYAETEIYNGAPGAPVNSPLAAIQRIGAGEVRVDRSLDGSDFAAWDSELATGALSFGFVDAWEASTVLTREVTVANYSAAAATFDIDASFRFEDDVTNGAVDISAPPTVLVPANGTATFDVTLAIDGEDLRLWTANSGGNGANPAPFDLLEYDGFVELTAEGEEPLHLAWHALPRASGQTTAESDTFVPEEAIDLDNEGASFSAIDGFSLLGESPVLPTGAEGANLPTIDLRYAGVQTFLVPPTFCDAEFVLVFAVNTWERQTHANAPAAFEWDIDIDGDDEADYAVFNFELAGNLSDGRNVVIAQEIETGDQTIFFFTDHGTNSANTVLTICGEQIGLTADDLGTTLLSADVLAVDTYFQGRVTDVITDLEFLPFGERYFPVFGAASFGSGDVPAGGTETVTILDFGEAGTNPNELGVLLLTDSTRVADDEDSTVFKTGAAQEFETIVLKPGEPVE